MTRDPTASEERSSRSYWGLVLWSVAVIVFYVLSAGPAAIARTLASGREHINHVQPAEPEKLSSAPTTNVKSRLSPVLAAQADERED